jgi:hypothetical protein
MIIQIKSILKPSPWQSSQLQMALKENISVAILKCESAMGHAILEINFSFLSSTAIINPSDFFMAFQ